MEARRKEREERKKREEEAKRKLEEAKLEKRRKDVQRWREMEEKRKEEVRQRVKEHWTNVPDEDEEEDLSEELEEIQLDEEEMIREAIRRSLAESLPQEMTKDEREAKKLELQRQLRELEEEETEELERTKEKLKDPKNCISADSLMPEPHPGDSSTVEIVIKLPSLRRVTRRFRLTDPVEQLLAFVESLRSSEDIPQRFRLRADYPLRTFEEPSISLSDAGIQPPRQLIALFPQ